MPPQSGSSVCLLTRLFSSCVLCLDVVGHWKRFNCEVSTKFGVAGESSRRDTDLRALLREIGGSLKRRYNEKSGINSSTGVAK